MASGLARVQCAAARVSVQIAATVSGYLLRTQRAMPEHGAANAGILNGQTRTKTRAPIR